MGGVALVLGARDGFVAVQIAHANVQRVHLQTAGDVAHDGFDQDHALRPAKAAKGSVALGVQFAAVGGNLHILQVIGVVAVEDGAVSHRARQVGAETAVGGHHQLQGGKAAGGVKASGVGVGKRMALAGDQKIVVAVQAQLDGAFQLLGGHGGPHGQVPGLRFFTAKTTAHASALHAHGMVVQSQRVGDPVLHLAGVLGAAVHHPLVLFLRQHIGHLAFKIEMLLPAHFQRAAQGVGGGSQCCVGIAPTHKHGRQHVAFFFQRLVHAQDGGQGFDGELHFAGGAACLHHRGGENQPDDLTDVLHRVRGKHRLVARKGGQHRVAGNILGQHHVHHAGHGQRGSAVHPQQAPMRHGGEDGRCVQRAPHFGHVVDIGGGASDLRTRALVGARDARGGWMLAHAATSCAMVSRSRVCRSVCTVPWLSSQKRCSRLPSTVLR